MPIWKLQTSIACDTMLPRDACVITPHFNDGGVGSDPQQLCEDWADVIQTWLGNPRQVVVKAYDAQGTVPVYPEGNAIRDTGLSAVSLVPRELSVCLSYYSERNIPRQRGRLYIPYCAMDLTTTGVRVAPTVRTKVAELAAAAADLGGLDVDWCVYSRLQDVARPVTHWWIDDEWDIMRSRGLRGVDRTVGTTSEG